ncbi:MAG: CPBP family intramembrane glutamic endopeptidase [Acidobacteriota bacterium]
MSLPGEEVPAPEPGRLYRLAWWFYLVLALVALLWIGLRDDTISVALFWNAESWWIDLLVGISGGGLLLGLWHLAARFSRLARDLELQLGRLLGRLEAPEAVALAVVSGIGEELFFRGALQGSVGWFWATLVFALVHTGPGSALRLWGIFAALAGGLFGALLIWRGNLLAPVVAHFLVNAVNLLRIARRNPAV